jgi:hypothetical protein
MSSEPVTYPGYHFPAEVIAHAVWLYHVFGLSLRDVELILAERGIGVAHESVLQWYLRFGADFARKLRRRRPRPGDTWHLDEVLLRMNRALPTFGARWIRTASCSTSSCRREGTRPPSSASSNASCRRTP